MSNVLALDIETKNMSTDIGGFGNPHMFIVSTCCTWDGKNGTVYIDKPVDAIMKTGYNSCLGLRTPEVKPLSQLKYDLDDHFEKGGKLLGHNIVAFDLPILRDSMDIYCIRKYLKAEQYIDTSKIMLKTTGERYSLSNLVQHTLDEDKLMNSSDAPVMWKAGEYDAVAEYCLKDCELVYNLWKHGQDNNFVKGYSTETETEKTMEVEW